MLALSHNHFCYGKATVLSLYIILDVHVSVDMDTLRRVPCAL